MPPCDNVKIRRLLFLSSGSTRPEKRVREPTKPNRTIQEHISPMERRHDFEDIAKGADCVNALHVRS